MHSDVDDFSDSSMSMQDLDLFLNVFFLSSKVITLHVFLMLNPVGKFPSKVE